MHTRQIDRRRLLKLGGTALAAGLAGCSSGEGEGGDETPMDGGAETATETPTRTATETPTQTTTETPTQTTTDAPTQSPALAVANADSTDGTVTVPTVAIDRPGWLVVHPEASGGGPNGGVTLAERLLEPGSYSDVELTIDTLVAGDQTVYAMLHYDDPDDGEFTFPGDGDPPVTVDGSPLVEPFTVTGTGEFAPALSVTDQESDGATVTVPRATIDRPGWLVVHPEASGGGPNGGVTLAERLLRTGTYRDVVLDVSEPMSEDQTVYAMLHYDDPDDGEFTFPGDGDPPVTADGSPLVEPFAVTVNGDGNGG